MSHYFTNDEIKSNEKIYVTKINDIELKFYTDNGVFSKNKLDFGTRTLLENLEIDRFRGKILDFGCGIGPIGIYLSLKTKEKIDMIDINKRSISLAIKNSKLNNVNTNIFESNIYEKINKKYDFIVSNPPIRVGNEVLYKILFEAKEHLNENGELWIVINKDQGAKTITKKLEQFYDVTIVEKNKGFYVIKAVNH
jgi:16S rRNA (guanine1207-N2)-methyltransferase